MKEIDKFKNELKDMPSLKEVKEGYLNIFAYSQLKRNFILGGLSVIGILVYLFLNSTTGFLYVIYGVCMVLSGLCIWPVALIVLLQPLFRFLLQLIISLIELIKMFLFAIQYCIYMILEKTLIGRLGLKYQKMN